MAGMDAYTAQALEMITSNKARDAFDISREPESVRARYGKGTEYLQHAGWWKRGCPWSRSPHKTTMCHRNATASGTITIISSPVCGPCCRSMTGRSTPW